jgi:hypothetical protein
MLSGWGIESRSPYLRTLGSRGGGNIMAEISKNARVNVVTQQFFCACGGEVKMKSVFSKGKLKYVATCNKCNRSERRPSDFR